MIAETESWLMNPNRKYKNDLETGTGIHNFILPKNVDLLVAPENVMCPDSLIPESIKDNNLKISYIPQLYIVKLDANKQPTLTDICGKLCSIPKVLGSFREGGIPEIRINGFALAIDKSALDYTNQVTEPKQKQKLLQKIGTYFQEFSKLCSRNPVLSMLHELKHLQNNLALQKLTSDITKAPLSAQQFATLRYADEISATTTEFLYAVEQYNQTGKDSVFGQEFAAFKKMLTLPQTKKILHNPQKLIEVSTKMWLNNPRNHTYTATNGDFCQQVNHFAESHQGTAPSNKLYTNIIKEFMSFEFEGKKIDGSNSVKLIVPEAHIYQDAQEKMSSRQTITAPAPIRHGPWSGRDC